MIHRVLDGLASRAHALEVLLGVGLLVAGVATFSLGAALIVAGLALLTPIVWPSLRRAR